MAKKNILVKDILGLFKDSDEINIIFYSYGIWWGSTANDNLDTVGDMKNRLINECLRAKIFEMEVVNFDGITPFLRVKAEMVY